MCELCGIYLLCISRQPEAAVLKLWMCTQVIDGAVAKAAKAGWNLGRHFDETDDEARTYLCVGIVEYPIPMFS